MTTRGRTWVAASLVAGGLALASAGTAAQAAFTAEERTAPPYHLPEGSRDMVERADRHERLARAAEAAGDQARAARHLAKACYARSEVVIDVTLQAPACHRARALARAHGVLDVEVSLLTTEGNLRAWILDIPGSVASLTAAIERGASLDPDRPEGGPLNDAHLALGAIMIEAGQFGAAREELTFARDHCRVSGNPTCLGYSEMWLCRLHTQLGDFGAARAACEAAQAAADGDVFVLMNLSWMEANLEAALERHEASLAAWMAAWQRAQVRGGELLRPTLMNSIADTLVRLGRLDEAEAWQRRLEEATAAGRVPASYAPQTAMRRGQIAMARGRLDEAIPALEAASQSSMYELAIGADYALAAAYRSRRDLAGAREALERALARIEAGRTSVGGAALRASYLSMHAKAYRELIRVRWEAEGPAAAAAALEIAEAGRARALLDALGSAQVAGAAAPTLSATAVQATLGPGDVLIEYVSSEDELLAITVTRDRIAITPLPRAGTAATLGRRVDFFSALVQESDDEARLGPTARRLYHDVLGPALAGVPADARTLVIAADGPLHRLPFDAIGDPDPLIDRWDIVTLPSASALANRNRRAPHAAAALVVAAPATPAALDPLPAAATEAAAIRRRVGGEVAQLSGVGATEAGLTALGLSRFAVLHFASHAVTDETTPLMSALMLAPGDAGGDGRWTAEQIYRASIPADLVVLSACSTAAGAPTPGEGVMSLARAFLYAGAGATIATLWDVPDAAGPIFADALYRGLASGGPLGATAAEARRELRRQGAPPRAWAAYVVSGHPAARVGVTARHDAQTWAATAAAIVALLLLVAATAARAAGRPGVQPLAFATGSIAAAGLAVALQIWPALAGGSLGGAAATRRGAEEQRLAATVTGGRVQWAPIRGADEHTVEIFDAGGVPIATQAGEPMSVAVPPGAAWVRVEARYGGQALSRSALIPMSP